MILMSGGKPVPAAQYLRTSMPQHQCSIANQREAISNYAKRNGFRIVRTYVDAGKSGVNLKQRPSLKSLLREVNSGQADFKAILTYDISRWGRFQDTDEPASYEFMCKRAGTIVRYCAEEFPNDGSVSSSTMKILKRMMAAEYSRELSVKVYAGQRRLAQLGFMVGGTAPYGLRRLALSPDGRPIRVLLRGNWKGSARST
jgi:DNA invertase Pin-like site-specific DNA recombinase